MSKVDRRIQKSQDAIQKAVIELMSEKNFDDITIQDISDRANVSRGTIYLHYTDKFDLLDKLIEAHIKELSKICDSAWDADMSYIDSDSMMFKYFENNYKFFSTMLASRGAPYFRTRYLDFVIKGFKVDLNVAEGKNHGFNENIILQFIGSAYVGVVEWWINNGMPYPPHVMAEQVGTLLERNV